MRGNAIRYSPRMVVTVRAEVRTPWPPRRSAPTILALALSVACADKDHQEPGTVESSAGSSEPASEPEAEAGGVGGQRGESSHGGTSGGADDAPLPVAGAETDPDSTEPPDDEPPVEDPGDEPEVTDPPPDDEGEDEVNLPCDVEKLLRTRCQSCHSSPPTAGATVPLITYADLTARSQILSSVTVAARSLQRMQDSLAPMPPAPASPATSADIARLQAWLQAGAPKGSCEHEPEDPGESPYDAPVTCTSGSYWTAFDSGAPWMNPGLPCIKCHRQNFAFAPVFSVAGTVFPTAHEPDTCFGVPATTGAQVIITDANGQELSPIRVVSGGNFGEIISGLALPYRAKVVVGGNERVMLTPQTNGDCNACHTQAGAQGARGRIIVP